MVPNPAERLIFTQIQESVKSWKVMLTCFQGAYIFTNNKIKNISGNCQPCEIENNAYYLPVKGKNWVHLRGHSKKTSSGGGEAACQNWWQKVTNGERVTQYSDVSHSVFMLIIYFISSYLQIITPSIPCTVFLYVNEC